MTERTPPPTRSDYPVFVPITTRWMDNDVFGHANNVVYYSFFDTTVCSHLVANGVFHPTEGEVIGVVVESGCTYFSSVGFPDRIAGGLRAGRVGRSSVRYEVGIFREEEDAASAAGFFTHVYVDRQTRRPVALPTDLHRVVSALLVG